MKLIPALAAVVLLTGCGTQTRTVTDTVTVVQTQTAATTTADGPDLPASARPTSCTVYLEGEDASMVFFSPNADVSQECATWITVQAQAGELWTHQPPRFLGTAVICRLETAHKRLFATVLDDPGGYDGTKVCTQLIAAGWAEISDTE